MFSRYKKSADTAPSLQSPPDTQVLSDGSQDQAVQQTSLEAGQLEADQIVTDTNIEPQQQSLSPSSQRIGSDSANAGFVSTDIISKDEMASSELAGVYQRLGISTAQPSSIMLKSNHPAASADNLLVNHKTTITGNNKKGKFLMNTLDKHTSKSFDMELDETISLFLKMGNTAAAQVAKAIHALTDADEGLAKEVINADHDINQMELDVDERILLLVAKRQPTAIDLRVIMAMSKGVVDLERIGDEAVKIAQMAVQVVEEGSSPRGYSEVQHLSNQVRLMTHNALEAFVHQDAEQAFDVMRNDSVINEEYQSATRSLMTYIMEDSRHVSKVINILWVLRALERIGDHARNIAELVVYSSSGTDVRHTDFKKVEQAIQEVTEQRAARQALSGSQASTVKSDAQAEDK